MRKKLGRIYLYLVNGDEMMYTFEDKRLSPRDLIQKVRKYNVQMNGLAKRGVGEMHTGNIENLLENFSMLMSGDYGEEKTIQMPVEVVREIALFAAVTLSRLLCDRYKLEKALGRPVNSAPLEEPSKEDLTKAVLSGSIESTST